MKNLVIVGAGGHGKVVLDCALSMNVYSKIIFVDGSHELVGKQVLGYQVALEQELESLLNVYSDVVIAIGDNRLRLEKTLRYKNLGFIPATLIHAAAVVSRFASIGSGTVVFANAVVNAGANIADACIINTSAVVEHDCILQDGVHISPNAAIGGSVFIGKNTWVGIGASIGNNIHISENVVIGAGAAVVGDIRDNVLAVGVPAVVKKYYTGGRDDIRHV